MNSEEIYNTNFARNSGHLILSAINQFSTKSYFPVRANLYRITSLSQATEICQYSYKSQCNDSIISEISAYSNGECHGLISFFHAQYGRHMVTNDVRDNGHWHQAFHPLDEPIYLEAGQRFDLSIDSSGGVSLYPKE